MTDIRPLTPADPDLGNAALRYLARNEAMNCVQIGLMLPFMRSEYESTWYVAIEGQAIAGVASQGGPFNIILSGMEPATAAALAPVLQRDVPDAPGLLGPRDVVHAYVEAADRPIATHMENGVYACTQVMWPESVPDGSARFANDHDLPWMIEWMTRFHIDVGEDVAREDATNAMTGKLRTGGFVIWQDEQGAPVSLVGYGNATPRGIRIGPVYTPEEHRGRGYATYATAVATQHLFDSGREIVFLYTDLANPTSNHIYQQIGYVHQGDVINVRFTD
jgi:predicted GNAT family acetyltransferase